MTLARLPQLRSWLFPMGVPSLNGLQQALVDNGNNLMLVTSRLCMLLVAAGAYFSVENPVGSWLWALEPVVALWWLDGTIFTVFRYDVFGTFYAKPTGVLHNTPSLHKLAVQGVPVSDEDKIVLRGKIWFENNKVFKTRLAQAYPAALGVLYGDLVKEAMLARESALHSGLSVPMALEDDDQGLPLLRGQSTDAWFEYVCGFMQDECTGSGFANAVPLGGVDSPFVENGNGAVKGLNHEEHVKWAMSRNFPLGKVDLGIDDSLACAINFELQNPPEVCDAFRLHILEEWVGQASRLKQSKRKVAGSAPGSIAALVSGLHCPLIKWLVDKYDFPCKSLPMRCAYGFQFAGSLDPCGVSCVSGAPVKEQFELDEVRQRRRETNEWILGKLKQSEFSADLMTSTLDDAAEGMMTEPIPLCEVDLGAVSLTRRLAVREERSKGWRTRAVDHFTESFINLVTRPVDRVRHDTIDVLIFILKAFLSADISPLMWKRDVRKAFRKLPVDQSFKDLCWVVFLHNGVAWCSQHLGMPFGSVSAVYAWHRFGGFISWLLVNILKAPVARYVDDFFGASAYGVLCTGGVAATILTDLLGVPCDVEKSVDFAVLMVVRHSD